MRISDWSSDVCSSDLSLSVVHTPFNRILAPDGDAVHHGHRLALCHKDARYSLIIHRLRTENCRKMAPNIARFAAGFADPGAGPQTRSEEQTSELQSLMRNSIAVLCLTKKNKITKQKRHNNVIK